MKARYIIYFFFGIATLLMLNGCFTKAERIPTNYYILDYLSSTENPTLVMKQPFKKTLEVNDTNLPKTYSRNQLVVKEHFSQIMYLSNELWANRLYDSVPNLIAQRMKAYNIFSRVDRDLGEVEPDYYLDTNILNIEKIAGDTPLAYIRIEFYLRDRITQKALISYQHETSQRLYDDSIVYLVQVYNELIMAESDVFAAKCIDFLSGKPVYTAPQSVAKSEINTNSVPMDQSNDNLINGELLVPKIGYSADEIQYIVNAYDNKGANVFREVGEYDVPMTLSPGDYVVVLGDNKDIPVDVTISPHMRSVVKPVWGELVVKIMDDGQNQVRTNYDIWIKKTNDEGFDWFNQGTSKGDDEIGEPDKIWILNPGNYMIKLQGGSWNDYKDFATVDIGPNERKTLSVIVDPEGTTSYMIGAGVLGDDDILKSRRKIHRGAIHTNVNVSSNNSVNKDKPTRAFSLSGQFDNRIEYDLLSFDYSMRSIYDVGMNIATGSDFNINVDNYSIKNTLLLLPLKKHKYVKTLGFYGRADMTTHFFDERSYYSTNKNLLVLSPEGDTTDVLLDQGDFRTKIALFPAQMREGSGLTYRVILGSNASISLRGGYGWQQNYKHLSYTKSAEDVTVDGVVYDVYQREDDLLTQGFESTLILNALNIFNTFSITSTFDALFPMGQANNKAIYESDNRFNFRLLRNVSVDVNANIQYNQANQDYVIFDYSSFLRLSLYY